MERPLMVNKAAVQDDGRTWSSPVRQPEDPEQWLPWLARYQMGYHDDSLKFISAELPSPPSYDLLDADLGRVVTPDGRRTSSLQFFQQCGYLAAPPRSSSDRQLISRALRRHQLLHAPHSPLFDMYCALAKDVFNVAFSSVSLCTDDSDQIQILSPRGAGLEGLCDAGFPRSSSLCAHAMLLGEKTAVIRDRGMDWRFKNLDFAPAPTFKSQRQGGFGFYASVPLVLSAPALDSDSDVNVQVARLCIIDLEPRPNFGQHDVERLQTLGRMASVEAERIWLERKAANISACNDLLQTIHAEKIKVMDAAKNRVGEEEQWRKFLDALCSGLLRCCSAEGAAILNVRALTQGEQVQTLKNGLRTNSMGGNVSIDYLTPIRRMSALVVQRDLDIDQEGFDVEVSIPEVSARIAASAGAFSETCIPITSKLANFLTGEHTNGVVQEYRTASLRLALDEQYGVSASKLNVSEDPLEWQLPCGSGTYIVNPIATLDGSVHYVYLQYWSCDHAFEGWEKQILKQALMAIEDTNARRRAWHAESIKLDFLQHVSHELRTPLHGMSGIMSQFVGTLESLRMLTDGHDSDKALINELMRLCYDVTSLHDSLQKSINDLIDLSAYVEDGSWKDHISPDDQNKSKESEESVSASLEQLCWRVLSPSSLNADFQAAVPWFFVTTDEASRGYRPRAGAPMVKNVLQQFFSNAIHAVSETEKVAIVSLKVYRPKGGSERLCVAITDNGVGMRPEMLQSFTDPFVKADRFRPGMGLGATLGYSALSSLGGALDVTSIPDGGTTIVISLPAHTQSSITASPSWKSEFEQTLNGVMIAPELDQSFFRRMQAIFSKVNVKVDHKDTFSSSLAGADIVIVLDVVFLADVDLFLSLLHSRDVERITIVVLCRHPSTASRVQAIHHSPPDAVNWLHCLCNPITDSELRRLQSFLNCSNGLAKQKFSGAGKDPMASPTAPVSRGLRSPSEGFDSNSGGEGNAEQPSLPASSFVVLIVEDNPLNLRLLVHAVRKAGCTCVSATNGREAVERFKRKRPAVILLDINMPVMDGFQACLLIRKEEEEDRARTPCRIVAVTALSQPADKARGLEVGMDEWRTKPANLRELRADMEAWRLAWTDPIMTASMSRSAASTAAGG